MSYYQCSTCALVFRVGAPACPRCMTSSRSARLVDSIPVDKKPPPPPRPRSKHRRTRTMTRKEDDGSLSER